MLDIMNTLKNLDVNRMSLEDAVGLSAYGKSLLHEYAEYEVEAPEWLILRTREIQRLIGSMTRDAKEKRLRELKARRESLDDAATRKRKTDAEIKKLETELEVA